MLLEINYVWPEITFDIGTFILLWVGIVARFVMVVVTYYSSATAVQKINWKLEAASTGLALCLYIMFVMVGGYDLGGWGSTSIGFFPREFISFFSTLLPKGKFGQALQAPEIAKPTMAVSKPDIPVDDHDEDHRI